MAQSDVLLHQALELPPSQRARLIQALLESLESSDEIDRSWDEEIARRLDRVRDGSATLIASDDLLDGFPRR
jgi:putative addiction module component (TIGR02574 family)